VDGTIVAEEIAADGDGLIVAAAETVAGITTAGTAADITADIIMADTRRSDVPN